MLALDFVELYELYFCIGLFMAFIYLTDDLINSKILLEGSN